MHPKAFVSYSWDSKSHKKWVASLAERLRREGVDVRLDQWDAVPGDQLTEFMESQIRDNDYVLIICTPRYKSKADSRLGGVGYEEAIMTGELLTQRNERKFIPILSKGTWLESAPSWLKGKYYIDLSEADTFEDNYEDLRSTIMGERWTAPPLGNPTGESEALSPPRIREPEYFGEVPQAVEGAKPGRVLGRTLGRKLGRKL